MKTWIGALRRGAWKMSTVSAGEGPKATSSVPAISRRTRVLSLCQRVKYASTFASPRARRGLYSASISAWVTKSR
jgi:hypothetical protein